MALDIPHPSNRLPFPHHFVNKFSTAPKVLHWPSVEHSLQLMPKIVPFGCNIDNVGWYHKTTLEFGFRPGLTPLHYVVLLIRLCTIYLLSVTVKWLQPNSTAQSPCFPGAMATPTHVVTRQCFLEPSTPLYIQHKNKLTFQKFLAVCHLIFIRNDRRRFWTSPNQRAHSCLTWMLIRHLSGSLFYILTPTPLDFLPFVVL